MNRYEIIAKRLVWSGAFLLTAVMAGCGGGGDDGGGPGNGGGTPPPPVDAAGAVCDSATSTGCVNLASAGTYAVLGQSGTTNTGTSAVTGNIGTSPVASTATTGFAETVDASNTFATSSQVNGKMFASDYTGGTTAADLNQAVLDSVAAYNDAGGRTPTSTNGGGDLGGQTLTAGVYQSNGPVTITQNVTLQGSATDVFIFQVGSIDQAANTQVVLSGGVVPQNVFWQVVGDTNIGAGATFEGIIITGSSVTLGSAATLHGRVYAAGPVTLNSNTVTRPGQ